MRSQVCGRPVLCVSVAFSALGLQRPRLIFGAAARAAGSERIRKGYQIAAQKVAVLRLSHLDIIKTAFTS